MEKREIKEIKGIVSDETVGMWKAKYRKVYEITIDDDEETYAGYFRRPDMDMFSVINKMAKTDEVKAANILFDHCWLGGDPLVREDSVIRMTAIASMQQIFAIRTAELKNL
jgi:hypothetical protein